MAKGFLQRMGILEDDSTKSADTSVASTPTIPVAQPVYQVIGVGMPAVSPELMQALMVNIGNAANPNNLQALTDMAETLKAAIVDESTRIKAAAAALKLSFADITLTINVLVAAVGNETASFKATDIAGMDESIASATANLDKVKLDIDATIARLNDLTVMRDNMVNEINQAQQERNNKLATFEATAAKIVSVLEEERKRIQIYLP